MVYSDKTLERNTYMKELAKQQDIYNTCRTLVDFVRDGGGAYKVRGTTYRVLRNKFVDLKNGRGGKVYNSIDFCEMILGMDYKGAVAFLTEGLHIPDYTEFGTQSRAIKRSVPKVEVKEWKPKEFTREELEQMVDEYETMEYFPENLMSKMKRNVFGYLCNQRKIDGKLVTDLVKDRFIRQDKNGTIYFVWKDHRGKVMGADKRGFETDKDGELKFDKGVTAKSVTTLGFNIKTSDNPTILYVFEAPIDLLSYMTMYKGNEKLNNALFIAMGGVKVSVAENFLKLYPSIERIVYCGDHDEVGEGGYHSLDENHSVDREYPYLKDWNEDLKRGLYPYSHRMVYFVRDTEYGFIGKRYAVHKETGERHLLWEIKYDKTIYIMLEEDPYDMYKYNKVQYWNGKEMVDRYLVTEKIIKENERIHLNNSWDQAQNEYWRRDAGK